MNRLLLTLFFLLPLAATAGIVPEHSQHTLPTEAAQPLAGPEQIQPLPNKVEQPAAATQPPQKRKRFQIQLPKIQLFSGHKNKKRIRQKKEGGWGFMFFFSLAMIIVPIIVLAVAETSTGVTILMVILSILGIFFLLGTILGFFVAAAGGMGSGS